MCEMENGEVKNKVFFRLKGEKLTWHRFSEDRKLLEEYKPALTLKRSVNQSSEGLRNCIAVGTWCRDRGDVDSWGNGESVVYHWS